MRRRGFFGLMAGAAAAGPSMAKQAVAGMESLSVGGVAGGLSSTGYAMAGLGQFAGTGTGLVDEYNPLKWARDGLAEFIGQSASDLMKQRLNTTVHALDPDLAGMRAISLGTKIRLQRDRNFDRQRAEHRWHLETEIQRQLKRLD